MTKPSQKRRANRGKQTGVGTARAAGTVAAALLLSLASCHAPYGEPTVTAEEALNDYAACLERISRKKSATTAELIAIVKDWQAADSSVCAALFAHSNAPEDSTADTRYRALHDSISEKLCLLVDSRKRTLRDYVDVARAIPSPCRFDSTLSDFLATAQMFFSRLDSVPTFKADAKATVKKYKKILEDANKRGFHSQQEVLSFLATEDAAFRSFLSHLSAYAPNDGLPIDRVSDLTESVMKNLVANADTLHLFDQSQMAVLLTLRNNRRLLQNALQCVSDIRRGRVMADDDHTMAYFCMLLKPWFTFNHLSILMMDDAQLARLYTLADETPHAIAKIASRDTRLPFGLASFGELPAILITNITQVSDLEIRPIRRRP